MISLQRKRWSVGTPTTADGGDTDHGEWWGHRPRRISAVGVLTDRNMRDKSFVLKQLLINIDHLLINPGNFLFLKITFVCYYVMNALVEKISPYG